MSDETSRKIRNMGLLCAMLVVGIHVVWPCDVPLSPGWFLHHFVKQGVARIAVPFFFVVSGFLLARHFDEDGWWEREVAKRVRSLLVPFVFWSLAYVVATIPLAMIADPSAAGLFGMNAVRNFPYCVLGFDLTDHPMLVPLWYVRCLFLFVLAAGVFKFLVVRFGIAWLACAFLLSLLAEHLQDEFWWGLFSRGVSASGVFYFSVGMYLQRKTPGRIPAWAAVVCAAAGLSLLAAGVLSAHMGWSCERDLRAMSLPLLAYATWRFVGAARLPDWLVRCSFPIYVMHFIALAYFWTLGRRLSLNTVLFSALSCAGGIAASVASAALLRRLAPKFAAIVFGGR